MQIKPNDDFFCGVRFTIDRQIRGSYAMCDKPQGHIQTKAPCTNINYEEAIFPSYESSAAQADEDGMIEIQYGTGVKKVKLTESRLKKMISEAVKKESNEFLRGDIVLFKFNV